VAIIAHPNLTGYPLNIVVEYLALLKEKVRIEQE